MRRLLLLLLAGCDGGTAPPSAPVPPPLTFTCDEADGFACAGAPGPSWRCSSPQKAHPTLGLLACYSDQMPPLRTFPLDRPHADLFAWPPGARVPIDVELLPQNSPATPETPTRVWIYLPTGAS